LVAVADGVFADFVDIRDCLCRTSTSLLYLRVSLPSSLKLTQYPSKIYVERIHFMSALVGIQVSTKHGIQPTYEFSFALHYTVEGELHKKYVRTGRRNYGHWCLMPGCRGNSKEHKNLLLLIPLKTPRGRRPVKEYTAYILYK
jgi:hypothetical protein